jgi:predicted ArsR family transcriptional regulator
MSFYMDNQSTSGQISAQSIPLERDVFLRTMIRELAANMQDLVGLEEVSDVVSGVGQKLRNQIHENHKTARGLVGLDRSQVAAVLVDSKRRNKSDFVVIEETEDKIVLGNHVCPIAAKVVGRPARCMLTSNAFGIITAENLRYAKVELQETIAQGHAGCRVVVHLKVNGASEEANGREYFKT